MHIESVFSMVSLFTSSPLLIPVMILHLWNVRTSPEHNKQTGYINHSFTFTTVPQ